MNEEDPEWETQPEEEEEEKEEKEEEESLFIANAVRRRRKKNRRARPGGAFASAFGRVQTVSSLLAQTRHVECTYTRYIRAHASKGMNHPSSSSAL